MASHTIKICMGSSCFARGNRRNLTVIEDFIARHAIDCELKGCCCAGKCRSGSHVSIDGEDFSGVDPELLIDLLTRKLKVKP